MDVALHSHVISGSGLPLVDVSMMHLNNAYMRQGANDMQQLFTIASVAEVVAAFLGIWSHHPLSLNTMVVVIKRGMPRQRIRALMGKLQSAQRKVRKVVAVYKYLGVLKVEEDTVAIQQRWRDEW